MNNSSVYCIIFVKNNKNSHKKFDMIGPEWNFIHWNEQKVDVRKSFSLAKKRDFFVFEENHTLKKAGW